MQAYQAALATVLTIAAGTSALADTEAFLCHLAPLAQSSGAAPLELRIDAQAQHATIYDRRIATSHGHPVSAELKRQSTATYRLKWNVTQAMWPSGPLKRVQFRMVLNLRNLKAALQAAVPGQHGAPYREAGDCIRKLAG